MSQVSGLQSISEKDELLRLLRKLVEAQKTKTNRMCVANIIDRLQREPTEKASWSSSLTEQDLRKADKSEPSYRSVPRLLCAGTSFNVVQDSPKEDCFRDMKRLLGPYWDLAPFPVKGGRCFIAGVLTYILDRQVTLMDIKKWFYTPNSQKMKVSEEVSAPLRERGVTWPPNADGFAQCTCYRPNVKSPSIHMCATVTAPSAAVIDPNFGVCLAPAPLGFADLHQIPLCSASEVAEGASSSTSNSDIHHLQLVAMPFPGEPADLLVTGHNMQHAKWPLSADSILPPWEADSALSLPGINDVNTSLDVSDSGLSCGETADFEWI